MSGARDIDLTSLIGSRICHDLTSPLGAIGNGVELLAMTAAGSGPEISLISESVQNANARIRFFRVAFGAARPDQMMSRGEITEILAGLARGGRQSIAWQPEGAVSRARVKLAFLCLQCLESVLPWGGSITISEAGGAWTLEAEAARLRDLDALWQLFDDPGRPHDLTPADIQFALAPIWAADTGQRLEREMAPAGITLRFRPG